MAIDFQPIDQGSSKIDFQPLDQSTSAPQKQGVLGAVGAALASRPELQPYGAANIESVPQAPSGPISGALQAAGQTLAAPIRAGATLSSAPNVMGQAASDIGLQSGHPLVGAGIGTAIQMAPYVVGGVGIYKGLNAVENPIVKGLMNTPEELGPQYGTQNQAAGISDKLPIQRGSIPKFPGLDGLPSNTPPPQSPTVSPLSYPKDTNTYLNFARDRVDSLGDQLTPQELADHKTILSNILNNLKVTGQSGTPVFAKAAQLQTDTSALQNTVIPGRADLNQAYGISKTLNPDVMNAIKNYAQKYGKAALKEAIGVGIGGAVASRFFK